MDLYSPSGGIRTSTAISVSIGLKFTTVKNSVFAVLFSQLDGYESLNPIHRDYNLFMLITF